MAIRVQCVGKQGRDSPWERITHIGGLNEKGARWSVTHQRAIQGIESGEWSFYVDSGDDRVRIVVRADERGHKYVTTAMDGTAQKNLLSLPDCLPG